MIQLSLSEHRCVCGKLLFKGLFLYGALEIKCRNCGAMSTLGKIDTDNNKEHYLLIVDEKGLITDASQSATEVLGYTRDELIGKHHNSIYKILPADNLSDVLNSSNKLGVDNHLQFDSEHENKDGKIVPVHVFLKSYSRDGDKQVISIAARIKSGTAPLIETVNGKDPFVNSECDFEFELDKTGILTYISSSFKDIFELEQDLTIGKNHVNHLPEIIKAKDISFFEHHSILESPYRILANSFVLASGKEIIYDVYFTPNFNDLGNFLGYRVLGWLINRD